MIEKILSYTKGFLKPRKPRSHAFRTYGRDVHGIAKSAVSPAALETCRALRAKGFEAYIVGGAVRDLITGHRPKDFDVVTNATPEEIKRAMRRAIIIGRRFRLVHVLYGKETIECSTFRALNGAGVKKDASGRVINDNDFGEMWEDAARRDFTINALFYDPSDETVIDYHDGMDDIRNGIVRMIGKPEERYREDPVRMLRAIRIASKLDYEIEKETLAPIAKLSPLLKNVPQARLFDEALKLLTCGQSLTCMKALRSAKLDRYILPSLSVALNYENGRAFLELAMRRTDERIQAGKKVSPSFLFATLLWPAVCHRYREAVTMTSPMRAITEAGRAVLDKHAEQMEIQARITADILFIWQMQVRLTYRARKTTIDLPYAPKFRASYDFLMLRSHLGYVDEKLVDWWKNFQDADLEARGAMIEEAVYDKTVFEAISEREAPLPEAPKATARKPRTASKAKKPEAPKQEEPARTEEAPKETKVKKPVRRAPRRKAAPKARKE